MFALFVDLDGVLADFDSGVLSVTGRLPDHQPKHVMWRKLAATDGFYEFLSWMPDGKQLWESVADRGPTILTGLPRGRWAEPQKRAWCARELGPEVPVITCRSIEKAKHARQLTPRSRVPVLIDDRISIRHAWERMGGVFIHHRDARQSLAELQSVLDREELQDS
jgi:hypothetical protein